MNGETYGWTWEEGGMRIVRSVARSGPGCHEGCGVLLYTKDGQLVKVAGDPDFPFSHGLQVKSKPHPQLVGDQFVDPQLQGGDAHALQHIVGKGVHEQGFGLPYGDAPCP